MIPRTYRFPVFTASAARSEVLLRAKDHGYPDLQDLSVTLHEELYFEAQRGVTAQELLRQFLNHPLAGELLGRGVDVTDIIEESWRAADFPLPFTPEVEFVAILRREELSVTLLRRKFGEFTVTLTRRGEALVQVSAPTSAMWAQVYLAAMILGAHSAWVDAEAPQARALMMCASHYLIGVAGEPAGPLMLVEFGHHQRTAGLDLLVSGPQHLNKGARRVAAGTAAPVRAAQVVSF